VDAKQLTAPCGLACWTCAYFKDNITEDMTQQVAAMLGMAVEDVPCEGCRSERGCSWENPLTGENGCKTKQCVEDKGLHNCSECGEFPCKYQMPVVDMADRVPHNTKIYNLSRIKLIGLEAWADEAPEITQRYFQGKFAYGQAPVLENETNAGDEQ